MGCRVHSSYNVMVNLEQHNTIDKSVHPGVFTYVRIAIIYQIVNNQVFITSNTNWSPTIAFHEHAPSVVVFQFEDFNYGRRITTIFLFNNCSSAWFFFITYNNTVLEYMHLESLIDVLIYKLHYGFGGFRLLTLSRRRMLVKRNLRKSCFS
jgi:hypothetical protein